VKSLNLHGVLSRLSRHGKAFPNRGSARRLAAPKKDSMPDSLRFLIIIACLAGAVYGAVWGLSTFPPEQTEIVKPLAHDKLRQN
jgi:hypothetical protein